MDASPRIGRLGALVRVEAPRAALLATCAGCAALAAFAAYYNAALLNQARRRREPPDGPTPRAGGDPAEDLLAGPEPAETELEDLAAGPAEAARPNWGAGSVARLVRRPVAGASTAPAKREPSAACGDGGFTLPGAQKIFVKTYGCAHNSSDSEFMMGLLRDYGYELVGTLEDADACVLNSCTVKNPSQDAAVNLARSARGAGKPVVLTGCVPSADRGLAESLRDMSVMDVSQLDRVVEVVEEALKGHTVQLLGKRKVLPTLDLPKVRRNSLVEIIPINGGCLGHCTYCKTKGARGTLASYKEEDIVKRALRAAAEGVSEVWLTSEDTGAYGLDIGTNIAALLLRVSMELPPGVMMKLGMTNPPYMLAHIDAVAEVMKRPNVFGFIHVPVQSGSDSVLRQMVREYTQSDFRRLVDGLRASVPELTVATDVICGFPSEGEADHKATMALVEDFKFPVLNISQFYPRPGTPAARMKQLPSEVKKRRSGEMTRLFDSYTTLSHLEGCEQRVWFSETDEKHGQTVGHTKGYAKIVVERDDTLLGRSAPVLFGRATKWHVTGTLAGPPSVTA